jgi:iron complex outermembrane recepter protein
MFKKRLLPVFVAMAATGSLPAQAQDSSDSALEEEIIVTGVRNAELNARQLERDKKIFSSVISQDDAGNFADQNVAESLQRLPGITLQKTEGEGRYVTVRGLGPGFVTVSMNGAELASAGGDVGGGDSRDFALDALPADMLGSIEVFKSLTPDMDLNSIGGNVNVNTVTAFDRKRDTLKMTVQNYYQDFREEHSPKISVQGTKLLADDTIGVGFSLSHEKRHTDTYEVRHHSTTDMRYVQADVDGLEEPTPSDARMLIPWEVETREEGAEKTRNGASLDLGYRPNENSEYYARFSYTEFTDLDIALREYYRFSQAGDGEIAYLDPGTKTFGIVGGDLQHQFFIQESENTTTAFSIGGENIFNDLWTLDYQYAHSVGKDEKPDGRRVQFRIRDIPMLGQMDKEYIAGQVVAPWDMAALAGVDSVPGGAYGTNGYRDGEQMQPNMLYDNIFIEDALREDTLDQISVNLRKDFTDGLVNYIKAGFTIKERERERNKDRWSIVPGDFPAGCGDDAECQQAVNSRLGDYETYTPNNPDFDHDFITYGEAERLLDITSKVARFTDPDGVDQESVNDDYLLTEDTAAAYVMAEFQLSEKSSVITGVRYEETDFTSTGNFSIRNDRFEAENEAASLDIAIPLQGASSSYDDLFPSIHYRYEMNDEILVRAALWTSFTRPSYDQARASAEVSGRVILCNPDTNVCSDNPSTNGAETLADIEDFTFAANNTLNFGNPTLTAMTATNFDASISWYASEDLFLQAAVFYKDIDDFIVDVNGATQRLDELPLDLPTEQVTQFIIPEDLVMTNVNFATNGDKAKVYGIELSYSQYFQNGLFVQSNATFMDSEANVGDTLRAGEIQLPDQADNTVNLTLGWENEKISTRFITNYRSKVLDRIGACSSDAIVADESVGYAENCKTWADVFHDDTFGLDFKATYKVTDAIRVYFDAINITDEKSIYYFEGNQYSGGNVLFTSEAFGRSFQLGVNVDFM